MKIVASQELARAGAGGVSASLMSHTIGSPPIARAARPEVKARVLPQVLSGEKISALAITEPGGGSDVANLAHQGAARRRSLRRQRREDLHHLGRARRLSDRCGAHRRRGRRRRQPAPDRGRYAGPVAHQAEEDGLVGLRHRDAAFRRLPRAGRKPDRRGRPGLQDHHAEFQQRAHGHGGELHRLCPRLPRRGDRLCQGAQDLWQADRAAPGDPPQDRRHGAEGRGLAGDAGNAGLAARSRARARSPKSA